MQNDAKKHNDFKLLTVFEASAILKLTRGALYQMIARREIPYIKMGRRVRFLDNDITEWLTRQKINLPDIKSGG